MTTNPNDNFISAYLGFISDKSFPCVAAREAVARQQSAVMVASHLACPHEDALILDFIREFVKNYRGCEDSFHSAAVIFPYTSNVDEETFDRMMWMRLQALSDLDAKSSAYDHRVDRDPGSEDFSFSLCGEAFFILGLHPQSNRPSRSFQYATLTFNPHDQFEKLRVRNQYDKMKKIVRKRDLAYSGSINPMLDDFGSRSEVMQYSGRQYPKDWKCPLTINHDRNSNDTTEERRRVPAEERSAPQGDRPAR